MIYFITVNYYSAQLIQKLVASISTSSVHNYQIVIVNNSPDDLAVHSLASASVLVLEAGENIGFGRACNLGLQWVYERDPQAIAWLINPDAYLPPQTLAKAEKFLKTYHHLSIIGTVVYEPGGQVWFGGGQYRAETGSISALDLFAHQPEVDYLDCDWVTGCSFLINLRNFAVCPTFDDAYFLYYEDFDFCRRYASQGHKIVITNQLSVIHQPSSITNQHVLIKVKYSTFGYLLTLKRYADSRAFLLRFIRLLAYALVLLVIKPQTAFGKLAGILLYLQWLRKV